MRLAQRCHASFDRAFRSTVQMLLQRRMKGLPTLSSAKSDPQKYTASEKEIVARIQNGNDGRSADAKPPRGKRRSPTAVLGFVRTRGRRRWIRLRLHRLSPVSNLGFAARPLAVTINGRGALL